jgi:hypothetical protein
VPSGKNLKVVGKTDTNKLKHIFGNPRHNLNDLIKVHIIENNELIFMF